MKFLVQKVQCLEAAVSIAANTCCLAAQVGVIVTDQYACLKLEPLCLHVKGKHYVCAASAGIDAQLARQQLHQVNSRAVMLGLCLLEKLPITFRTWLQCAYQEALLGCDVIPS